MENKTFKELLQETWEIYTNRFTYFLFLIVIFAFPFNVISEFTYPDSAFQIDEEFFQEIDVSNPEPSSVVDSLEGNRGVAETEAGEESTLYSWVYSVSTVLSTIAGVYISAMIILIVLASQKKEEIDVKKMARHGLTFLWPLLLTSLLMVFLLLPLFVLFIIPGIVFAVYWIFTGLAVVVVNKKYMSALRYSRQLVKGRWWEVVSRIVVLSILISIVTLGLFIPTEPLMETMPGLKAFVITLIQIISVFFSVFLVVYFLDLQRVTAGVALAAHSGEGESKREELQESEHSDQEEAEKERTDLTSSSADEKEE